jgi:senataxin
MNTTVIPAVPSAKDVEAILKGRAASGVKPSDADLGPVYRFLLPSSAAFSSTSSTQKHWYCPKAESDLHKEAATYLILLFAFRPEGTTKIWLDALQGVVSECELCARGFGAARRKLGSKWVPTLTWLTISGICQLTLVILEPTFTVR